MSSSSRLPDTRPVETEEPLFAQEIDEDEEEEEEEEEEDINAAYDDEIYGTLLVTALLSSQTGPDPSLLAALVETESPSESGTESLTWISWFCSIPGHEYFAEVAEDFIEDDFNLTGLNALVPFYKEALEMILDVEAPEEDSLKIPDVSIVESSAELLYGLIHQRYILTRIGMQQMVEKYQAGHFGYCPRVFCHSHPVLPCGRSDLPGLDTVKLFCSNCIDNYSPPSSRFHGVDGAFFGTTFPHLLFQCYRDLLPSIIAPNNSASHHALHPPGYQPSASTEADETSTAQRMDVDAATATLSTIGSQPKKAPGSSSIIPSTPPVETSTAAADPASEVSPAKSSSKTQDTSATKQPHRTLDIDQIGKRTPYCRIYTPRIYGFKVSEHAKIGPRMKWARIRPYSLDELDSV